MLTISGRFFHAAMCGATKDVRQPCNERFNSLSAHSPCRSSPGSLRVVPPSADCPRSGLLSRARGWPGFNARCLIGRACGGPVAVQWLSCSRLEAGQRADGARPGRLGACQASGAWLGAGPKGLLGWRLLSICAAHARLRCLRGVCMVFACRRRPQQAPGRERRLSPATWICTIRVQGAQRRHSVALQKNIETEETT